MGRGHRAGGGSGRLCGGGALSAATPVAGFGDEPALAQIAGATLAADGSAAIAGSSDAIAGGSAAIAGGSDTEGRRRVVAAFGDTTSPPAAARGLGPASGAFDVAFAANASGDVALTYNHERRWQLARRMAEWARQR